MQRGTHEHHAQRRVRRQQAADQDEQEVGEAVALVDLVHDDVRHGRQALAVRQHAQQHAVRAEHERRGRAAAAHRVNQG